eukprot:TRINITY_DN86300_c0_g1_i1.p1 TRINITY_DN86300_c0_g1~~TRINITY_DN86300_c0_g1_i1.p1  ORF type:complete len:291 (+),score=44.65 TRINITY_DN86300_c0_g1_i1:158-1030(+)
MPKTKRTKKATKADTEETTAPPAEETQPEEPAPAANSTKKIIKKKVKSKAKAKQEPTAQASEPEETVDDVVVAEDAELVTTEPTETAPAAPVDYVFDLHHLMVQHPTYDTTDMTNKMLQDQAQLACSQLVRRLFALPAGEKADVGQMVMLPRPVNFLPRDRPPPEPKPKTNWQKFAEKKGIRSEKKGTREYDEGTGTWKLRFGREKRARERAENAIVELPHNYKPKVPGGDPFLDAEMKTKAGKKMQRLREARNRRRGTKVAIDNTIGQLNTRSMGKFDKAGRPTKRRRV